MVSPGLRCSKCDYDLRGLPHPVCPECGTEFDPRAAAPSRLRLGPIAGFIAAVLGACTAAFSICYSTMLALSMIGHGHGGCGRCCATSDTELMFNVPVLLMLTLVAWGASRAARCGEALARTSALCAIAGWILCASMVR